MRCMQFSHPQARHHARCFPCVISVSPRRHPCLTSEEMEASGASWRLMSHQHGLGALVQRNSQGSSDRLIPILFRVKNVNCNTNFQTSVALTSKTVFLTYPMTGVEVYGEPGAPSIQGHWLRP